MNTLIKIYLVFLSLCGFWAHADKQPNIIIIYADDLGYGDVGCYGAEEIDTPHLDQMAKGGLRFTSAYATASTCTPSRYSLLTGEYPFRNSKAQILPGNAPLIIDPAKPTLASMLKSKGYATGLVGKWHLGLGDPNEPLDWNGEISPGPRELGFDYSFHMAATGDRVPTVYIENGHVVNLDESDPIEVSYKEMVGTDPTGLSYPHLLRVLADDQHAKTIVDGTSRIGYMSGGNSARWVDEEMPDEFLGKALDFIESAHKAPFFLYYAMHENHVPRLPHPRFQGATSLGVRGDAVVQLDWGVGEVFRTLKKLGIEEDTLVIFSSDNGPSLFEGYADGARELNGDHKPAGPWRGGKFSVWEGATRMPFIVSWKGTVVPGLSTAVMSQVDLFASIVDLVGATVPEGRAGDSENHLDALLGRKEHGRDYLVQQGTLGIKAIRKGNWKYVPPGKIRNRVKWGVWDIDIIEEPGALYFLPEDPAETNNLANVYPNKVEELRSLLEQELAR